MSTEKKEKVVELPNENKEAKIDQGELLKRLVYKPASLIWNNFAQKHPDPDRWILIWCNMGILAPNLYVTFRDSQGNYDLPHPTKRYPAQAWAYLDNPEIDQKELEQLKKELEEEAQAKKEETSKS